MKRLKTQKVFYRIDDELVREYRETVQDIEARLPKQDRKRLRLLHFQMQMHEIQETGEQAGDRYRTWVDELANDVD